MSFSKDINKFVNKTTTKTDDVFRKTALGVFGAVVKATPVGDPDLWNGKKAPPGYVGGHARANWQMGINTIPVGEVDGTSIPNPPNTGAVKARDVVYITNNVPYIEALEHGHSKQAAAGMVKVTLLQFKGLVNGNL